jgi:protein-S-isoprenylcysteine O-methyltransferase Ste14
MKIKIKNFSLRIMLLIFLTFPLLNLKEVYNHFYVYLTGNITKFNYVITNQWSFVFISTLIFLAFLIPLSYRRKIKWSEYGLVSAFFVSLFVEMFGIPLTILFASKYFIAPDISSTYRINNIIKMDFLGIKMGMAPVMVYGFILMMVGTLLIITGWITLYNNIKKQGLVASGIYSYSRHPQYLGFIFIILGWFIGWPTILTLIFTPILVYEYIRVCITEEKEIIGKNPKYKEYKERVPFFI